MSASPALKTAEERLHTLLLEHRNTPVMDRVKLYVGKFSGGKKLSEYLADAGATEEDKVRVVSTLVAILSTRDFSRLPELPVMDDAKLPPAEPIAPVNGAADEEEDDTPHTADEIRAIARKEARAELADVLERVARVLRETA